MTNPTIEIDLGEILGEIRQDLKQLSSNVSDLKVGQARLEERVNNLEKDHNEFKESTNKNFDDIKESTSKNFGNIKESTSKSFDDIKESTSKNFDDIKESTSKSFDDIKASTSKSFDDIKELIEKNNNEIKELIEKNSNETKELKKAQETLAADVADLKGAKSLIVPIVVAVTTAILTLVARTIPFG